MNSNLFEMKTEKKESREIRNLRLNWLRLQNFKGIKQFKLEPDAQNLSVYGENATGKSTLADSYHWLLFGKDSTGRTDFEIKTLNDQGEAVHGLSHEVEAEVEIDGKRIVLEKQYEEVWSKKRGSAHREFTGHTTNHFIDGVPVKAAEYQSTISEIADEQTWRMLTDPTYFSEQLHWQDRRNILLEVCGDVSNEEVVASSEELAKLPKILNGRSMEDHRKVVNTRRQELNRELDRIPVRITEVERGLPDISGFDRKKTESQLEELNRNLEEAEAERSRLKAGGEIAEKKREMAEVRARMIEIESHARRSADTPRQEAEEALRSLRSELDEARDELQQLNRKLDTTRQEINSTDLKIADLRDQWHQVDAEQLEFTGDTVCHACGQDLPEDRVEEAHKKALESFNESKSKRLTEINEQGRQKTSEKKALEATVNQLQGDIDRKQKHIKSLQQDVDRSRRKVEILSDEIKFPKEHSGLAAKRDRLQADIGQLETDTEPALREVGDRIKELQYSIAASQQQIQKAESRQAGEKRIEELQGQEEELAAEFEKLEHQLYLLDQFMRSKVDMLTNRINEKFELVRFKLFRELVNGGLEECCETTVNGVPYRSNLNHGSCINAGMEIIRVLQAHYGFAPVVWADQCESVTSLLTLESQVIRLVVSDQDEKLRVEKTNQNREAKEKA